MTTFKTVDSEGIEREVELPWKTPKFAVGDTVRLLRKGFENGTCPHIVLFTWNEEKVSGEEVVCWMHPEDIGTVIDIKKDFEDNTLLGIQFTKADGSVGGEGYFFEQAFQYSYDWIVPLDKKEE
jgi:hypothetical protein